MGRKLGEKTVRATAISSMGEELAAWHPAPTVWCAEQIGYLTISTILHHWVRRDRNHLGQIHSNILTRVWPHYGKARRFRQPGIAEE